MKTNRRGFMGALMAAITARLAQKPRELHREAMVVNELMDPEARVITITQPDGRTRLVNMNLLYDAQIDFDKYIETPRTKRRVPIQEKA